MFINEKSLTDDQRQAASEMHGVIDSNGDGAVSQSELSFVLLASGDYLPTGALEASAMVMNNFDADGGGTLSESEFSTFMSFANSAEE